MKLKNRYLLLRHGEALSNAKNIISSWPEKHRFPLTKKGKAQVKQAAKALKKQGVDFIFSSDLLRTKQTAEIIGKFLKINPAYDKRLREYDFGVLNGSAIEYFHSLFSDQLKRFYLKPEKGETYNDIIERMQFFLKEKERKHKGKNILIVSHQLPIILILGKTEGLSNKKIYEKYIKTDRIKNGEIFEIGD